MAFENQSIICGRIRILFVENNQEYAVIEKYKIVSSYGLPVKSYVPVHSFYKIEETDEVIVVHKKLITGKLISFKMSGTMYLGPMLNIFEHDWALYRNFILLQSSSALELVKLVVISRNTYLVQS